MPWVRLDDRITEHPKIAQVGPLGLALFVAGLAYCNRNLTDGYIPWAEAEKLLTWKFLDPNERDAERGAVVHTIGISSGMSGDDISTAFVVTLLVTAGLWEKNGAGYIVHDFSDYQPSKKEVLSARKAANKRQIKHRKDKRVENDAVTALSQRDICVSHGLVTPDPVPVPVSKDQEKLILSPKPQATPPPKASPKKDPCAECITILKALLELTGRKYRLGGKPFHPMIHARHKERGTLACLAVIRVKGAQWQGDPKMDAFLRPSTLFRAGNFTEYFAEAEAKGETDGNA